MLALLPYLMLVLLTLIITGFFLIIRKMNKFFEERGIKHIKPFFVFGNSFQSLLLKKGQIDVLDELYRMYPDEKLTGFYNFTTPYLVVQSADYVENITIKDFTHFTHRGFHLMMDKTQNPYDESLLTVFGNRWKTLRQKISPIFTARKLKGMIPSMETCSSELLEYLKNNPKSQVDLKKPIDLFTFDSVGSSMFGIESNVFKNPDSEYVIRGKRVFDLTRRDLFTFILIHILPTFLVKSLSLSLNKPQVIDYFSRIMRDTFKFRCKNNIQRNDIVQLLLEMKEKETIGFDNEERKNDNLNIDQNPDIVDTFEITDELITVHGFSFLTGGNDTLSLSIFYTCFELAQNIEIQEKVRDEIREKMKLHGGLNFKCVKELAFLEKCIKEALRLYPPAPGLVRFCTKDYTFPNGYTIHKGEFVQIPIRSIHRNPNYHEDPDTFKPERFDKPMKPGTYITFGSGPRTCIAQRYAIFHSKIAVSTILQNYRLRLHSKIELPLKFRPVSLFTTPNDDILFDLEPTSISNDSRSL